MAVLRPILMTSFAMIIGLIPLMMATGVGANGNSTLGTERPPLQWHGPPAPNYTPLPANRLHSWK